jgi:hypothetical protein
MSLFAVAVLIAVVLFADRLGPEEEFRRRFYQVGLAFAVVLFILALAAVIVPVPDAISEEPDFSPSGADGAAGVLRERVAIVVGAGLLLLLSGLYQSSTFPTISVGLMLAALVLLVSSVTSADSGSLIQLYYELELDAGDARNAVYAAVTGVGLALLMFYGFNTWDKPISETELEEEEVV